MADKESTGQLVGALAKEIYSDAVAPAMKVAGEIGADAAKVFRLIFFPLQHGAALQDRLARRIKEAAERVPAERRIAPRESIALPVAERLRFEDDGDNPIADLYINLLARAMDKERVGEAHPAFVLIIGQLAPDELLVLRQLDVESHRAFFRLSQGAPALTFAETSATLAASPLGPVGAEGLLRVAVRPEELAQPTLFLTFFGHLQSLGLTEFTNRPRGEDYDRNILAVEYYFIRLTDFGRLFLKACVRGLQST